MCVYEWIWGQLLESDWECRCLWPMVSATGVSGGVSVPATGASGGLYPTATGNGNGVCPENEQPGGTSVSEGSEGLSAHDWSRAMGHSLCSWCQLLGDE